MRHVRGHWFVGVAIGESAKKKRIILSPESNRKGEREFERELNECFKDLGRLDDDDDEWNGIGQFERSQNN